MWNRLSRIIPLFVELIVLGVIVIGTHEAGHMIAANAIGIKGSISLSLLGGHYYYQDYSLVKPWQDAVIGFGGGGFVALLLGILAICFTWQGKWERGNLDEAAICVFFVIFQLCYAGYETAQIWAGWFRDWSQLIGVLLGVAVPVLIFGKRLIAWWEEDSGLPKLPVALKKIVTLGKV